MSTFDVARAEGAFLGLAIGDALGAPVEFLPPGSFPEVTDFQPSPRFGLSAGQWTDDTIMAACLAESLLSQGGYDSFHVMGEYVAWRDSGRHSPNGTCFDIGIQTAAALSEFKDRPDVAASTTSAGNGTVMRLVPAVIATMGATEGEAAHLFEVSARDTHNSDLAAEATVFFGLALRHLIDGADLQAALARASTQTSAHFADRPNCFTDVAAQVSAYEDEDAHNSGFVIPSLGTAIWAVRTTSTFADAVLKAVNLGEDSDTVAAITGQMAGALYGLHGIPEHWRQGMWRGEEIQAWARALAQSAFGVLATRSY